MKKQCPIRPTKENYMNLATLLCSALSLYVPVMKTTLIKFMYLANRHGLYLPLMPTLHHHGVDPVDAEIIFHGCIEDGLLRSQNSPVSLKTKNGKYWRSYQNVVSVNPTVNITQLSEELEIPYSEYVRSVQKLIRMYGSRVSDWETDELLVRGIGIKTIKDYYNAMKENINWKYYTTRWIKVRSYMKPVGIGEFSVKDILSVPYPKVDFIPDVKRTIFSIGDGIIKKKEQIEDYKIRIGGIYRENIGDIQGNNVFLIGKFISTPQPFKNNTYTATLIESHLSLAQNHRIIVLLDSKAAIDTAWDDLVNYEFIVIGQLNEVNRKPIIQAHALIRMRDLPEVLTSGFTDLYKENVYQSKLWQFN